MRLRDALIAAIQNPALRIGKMDRSPLLTLDNQQRLFSDELRSKYGFRPVEVKLSAKDILEEDWYVVDPRPQ